jgi:hypothetical protein
MLHQSKIIVSLIGGIAAGPGPAPTSRLSLVASGKPKEPAPDGVSAQEPVHLGKATAFIEIAGERCSAYLAEAAVLVLVFAILDRFLMKERMEWTWASGTVAVSVGLLVASIAVELAVRRLAGEQADIRPTRLR